MAMKLRDVDKIFHRVNYSYFCFHLFPLFSPLTFFSYTLVVCQSHSSPPPFANEIIKR